MSYGAPELLGYRLLTRLQDRRGMVPKTVFHKFWSLSDRYAEAEFDTELGVPRYWYKYGELVDEQSVDSGFFVAPSAPWGGQAYKPVYDEGDGEFDLGRREQQVIEQTVEWALDQFDQWSARKLEAHQYRKHAPNEFIRSYSELRERLQYTGLDEQVPLSVYEPDGPDTNREVVFELLDQTVAAYPTEDPAFEPLSDAFFRWEDTARLLIEQERDFARLEVFLDEFVQVVSEAVLRFQFADGVDQERVAEWRTDGEACLERFESTLAERRSELLRERERSGVLQSVSATYDEMVLDDLTNDE
jgi:hypothetical protein